MFVDTFLRSKNQDCLGQVLSFLTCQELANVTRTTKVLSQRIFQDDENESDLNLIWEGAEQLLTNPWNRHSLDAPLVIRRTGSNAREHCLLFTKPWIAAKSYGLSWDLFEADRMKVD